MQNMKETQITNEKRGRGRPRKMVSNVEQKPKGKRGRPRKYPVEEQRANVDPINNALPDLKDINNILSGVGKTVNYGPISANQRMAYDGFNTIKDYHNAIYNGEQLANTFLPGVNYYADDITMPGVGDESVPDISSIPDMPDVPDIYNIPGGIPGLDDIPGMMDPDAGDIPQVPNPVQDANDNGTIPMMYGDTEPNAVQAPQAPAAPATPNVPQAPVAPTVPQAPANNVAQPQSPSMPNIPDIPDVTDLSNDIPGLDDINIPDLPGLDDSIPGLDDIIGENNPTTEQDDINSILPDLNAPQANASAPVDPEVPVPPEIPGVPEAPEVPSVPEIPGLDGMEDILSDDSDDELLPGLDAKPIPGVDMPLPGDDEEEAPFIPEVPKDIEEPVVPAAPEAPEVPEVPVAPEVPEVPEIPTVPEVPEEPVIPEVPDIPEIPVAPETPEIPAVPEVPEEPVIPEIPEVPVEPTVQAGPEIPVIPEIPTAPEVPEAPVTPEIPEVPEIPVAPEVPEAPVVPEVPEIPQVPQEPEAPVVPEIPEVPEIPVAPEIPVEPVVPEVPETPVVPEVPEIPQVPQEPVAPVAPEVPVTPEMPQAPVESNDDLIPGLDSEPIPGEEMVIPGIDNTVEDMSQALPGMDEPIPGLDMNQPLPGMDEPIPGLDMNQPLPGMDEPIPGLDMNQPLPGMDEPIPGLDMNQPLPGMETTDAVQIPGLDELDNMDPVDGLDSNMLDPNFSNPPVVDNNLQGQTAQAYYNDYNANTPNIDESQINYNNYENNNTYASMQQPQGQAQSLKPKVDYSMSTFNGLLTSDKKVVTFIGTTKNGTSFLVNNLAALFSSIGINTAILDMTRNKNSYYIYTKNEEELRKIAYTSIDDLKQGRSNGLNVDHNLTVYTALPNDGKDYSNAEQILSTIVQNHSVVLIDCDYTTDPSYFALCQEIYLVQSLDILTIQPLTSFLRDLKTQGVLEPEKIRVVINKNMRVGSLTTKLLIGGMSFYNDPAMSFMTELFNKDMVKYCEIPFDEKAYAKYLESMVNCNVSLSGYSQGFIAKLKTLGEMVYPLTSKQSYGKPNAGFAGNTNVVPGMK